MAGMIYEIKDDSFYLFACAELKARESGFVADIELERMLSAFDMEDFLKMRGETAYTSETAGIKEKESFNEAMVSSYLSIINYL